jgi:TolA-binding protein
LARIDDKADASAVIEQLITDFSSHSELPSSLYDIARRYERAKLYKDAENLYQRIIQQYGDSSSAEQARLGVCRSQALSYIESKNFEQATSAINGMLVDFAGHPDLSEALYDVGIRYERAGQYQQAKDAYRQITQGYPDSSHGGRAGLDSSKVDIYLLIDSGQTAAAETATESLIVSFSGHSFLPEALEQIAKRLEWSQNYVQAQRIYNQVAGHTQAAEALLNAEKCRILGLVKTGEYGSVRPAINQLVSDYPGYELLPWAVKQIANQYYEEVSELETEVPSEQFQSRISDVATIYELIINQLPNSKANAEACYNAGECYYKTRNYPKAIVYYQKLVDEHSYYPLTWNALFRVGHSYEKMAAAGLISEAEAEPKIRAAYNQLIEKYPDCKAAKAARRWLSQHN